MLVTSGSGNAKANVKTVPIRYVRSDIGTTVTISLDGGRDQPEYAGKLGFQQGNRAWQSVCANVRSPMGGAAFPVKLLSSSKFGGNVAKAGNIVSACFNYAHTPAQCAGLQVAVWKALEDGTTQADFSSGHLRVSASPDVMSYARQYYKASGKKGEAVYLQTCDTKPGGQDQLAPVK